MYEYKVKSMRQWKIITDEEVEQIHQTTLRILGEVGIKLDHPESREILLSAGASIKKDKVTLPPGLVEDCLSKCGGPVRAKGRGGDIVELGSGTLHWHNLGCKMDDFERRHHDPQFDVHPDSLPVGAAIFAKTAVEYLKRNSE